MSRSRARRLTLAVAAWCAAGAMAVVTPAMAGTPGAVAAARPLAACASGLTVSHRTVVFLDPGHGANVAPTKATSGGSTGIYSGESASGGGEDADVFTVALRAKALLEQAGYKVVLSRTSNPDMLRRTLWQKGNAAETANSGKPADIAVSLHTDVKANIGAGHIYYDNQGGYRQNNSNSTRRVFNNPAVAAKSKAYGQQFQKVRNSLQGTWIGLYAGHQFAASRNLGSYGTIPIVMLSAQHVPWVYNEFGRTTSSGLSSHDISVYVTSVVRGVEHSIGSAVVGCTA